MTISEPPVLSIADASVTEGDAGTTALSFTITRAGELAFAASVQWSTTDGSAIAPSDYVAVAPTVVSFAAGEVTKAVSVTVNGDTSVEPNDGFTVNLANPTGATIADGTAVGRITNDEAAAFSVDDATVAEGNAGTSLATFTVTRQGVTGGTATVQWDHRRRHRHRHERRLRRRRPDHADLRPRRDDQTGQRHRPRRHHHGGQRDLPGPVDQPGGRRHGRRLGPGAHHQRRLTAGGSRRPVPGDRSPKYHPPG